MMSYNNNWVNELKESYIEEKKAMNVVKKGAEVVAKGAKEAGKGVVKGAKGVVKALGTRGGSFEAMHLRRGGTYDHVEHEGNNLQEEMALNEDLLMLIDILCEELGIDVEELMEVTAFTDAERRNNSDILGMERHQLGRLRNLADRVNRGTARLNNPGNVAQDRLAAIMRAKGADVHAWDGNVRGASEYRGDHQVITPNSRISTGHTDEKGRMDAARRANLARKRDRGIAKAQLARRNSDKKWGTPEGID